MLWSALISGVIQELTYLTYENGKMHGQYLKPEIISIPHTTSTSQLAQLWLLNKTVNLHITTKHPSDF